MSLPRSHPSGFRPVVWIFGLLLFACGAGEDSALQQAQHRLERGDLETAQRVLVGVEGARAEALRAQIAAAAAHRTRLAEKLQAIRDAALDQESGWARREIAALLRNESDPTSVELIEQAQSDLATQLALSRRPALRSAESMEADAGASLTESTGEAAAGESASMAGATLTEARSAQSRQEWKTALALADNAAQDSAVAADARLVRESILSAARAEAESLLVKVRDTERSAGAAQAARELETALARFPTGSAFDSLRFEMQLLGARATRTAGATTRPAVAAAPTAARTASGAADMALSRAQSAYECIAIAQSRSSAGELGPAREAWLEAARRNPDASLVEECQRRARECDARIALREELADFARVDSGTAAMLGWRDAGDDSSAPKFETLSLGDLQLAIDRARVSAKARLGWVIEAIARGDEAQRATALEALGQAVERKEIDAPHASSLVAQAKAAIAEGGWVYQGGRWIEGRVAQDESQAAASSARAAKQAQLVGEFRRGSNAERDALFARLRESGDPELIARALELRAKDDWERLERNPNLRQLGALADDRRALDAARTKALDLIFDEERYFYPYNPPECPPQKAAKYAAVQREVDELVDAVRKVWEGSKRVRISDGLRQQLAALDWTLARAAEQAVEIAPVPSEWRFALLLPETNDIGLPEFAWDAGERAALVESDRIQARNARLWNALARAKPADDVPNTDEQRQVQITNEYRRMFGRRALAWNPLIESAAQGHSDHMANSGEFSHFEKGDPKRASPFDRMRLAGYVKGVSENISMGRSDPKSAHEGWTHSSGHHRNLLMRDHREMASAIASNYWTQNFGVDTSFLADL